MRMPLSLSMLGTMLLLTLGGAEARAEFIHATHAKPYPEVCVEANVQGDYVGIVNHISVARRDTGTKPGPRPTGTNIEDFPLITGSADPEPAGRPLPARAPDEPKRAPSPGQQPANPRFDMTRSHVSPGTSSAAHAQRPAFGAGLVRHAGEANNRPPAHSADTGAGSAHDRYANVETNHLPGPASGRPQRAADEAERDD